jgi:outer membrane protein OmpA-like peptidoglycan-associated protein/osmotically-inducible protein OsmY
MAAARLKRLLLPALVAVVGLSLLLGIQLTVTKASVERRLDRGVTEALARAGIRGADVVVDGRDVTIHGIAGSTVVLASAVNSVAGVEGVRTMTNDLQLATGETAPERGPSQVTAAIEEGRIRLTGAVPSKGDRTALREAAATAVGEDNVVDRIDVDSRAGKDGLKRFIALVKAFDPAGECQAELADGVISLFGRVPRETSRNAMVGAANKVKSDAAGIVDQLAIDEDTLPPAAVELQRRLAALDEIEFSTFGFRLDGDDQEVVERAAGLLKGQARVRIRVEGHTDSYGSAEDNLALSKDRAAEVREALIEAGVPAERVDAVGYGEYRPAVDPTGAPLDGDGGEQRDIVLTVVL